MACSRVPIARSVSRSPSRCSSAATAQVPGSAFSIGARRRENAAVTTHSFHNARSSGPRAGAVHSSFVSAVRRRSGVLPSAGPPQRNALAASNVDQSNGVWGISCSASRSCEAMARRMSRASLPLDWVRFNISSQSMKTTASLIASRKCVQPRHPELPSGTAVVYRQRLVDVGDEVAHVFEADGQAHGARRDARLTRLLGGEIARADELRRHHQRLGGAQARGEGKQLELR